MGERKHRLVDCNPEFRSYDGTEGVLDALVFDCPEGHSDCRIFVPFTPAIDGSAQPVKQRNGAQWSREGDAFEALTLSPSIRTIQQYTSREAAFAAGVGEEWFTERLICGLHIFIKNGAIEFCGDSK